MSTGRAEVPWGWRWGRGSREARGPRGPVAGVCVCLGLLQLSAVGGHPDGLSMPEHGRDRQGRAVKSRAGSGEQGSGGQGQSNGGQGQDSGEQGRTVESRAG